MDQQYIIEIEPNNWNGIWTNEIVCHYNMYFIAIDDLP